MDRTTEIYLSGIEKSNKALHAALDTANILTRQLIKQLEILRPKPMPEKIVGVLHRLEFVTNGCHMQNARYLDPNQAQVVIDTMQEMIVLNTPPKTSTDVSGT